MNRFVFSLRTVRKQPFKIVSLFSGHPVTIQIRLLLYYTVVGVARGEQVIEDVRFVVTAGIYLAKKFARVNYRESAEKDARWSGLKVCKPHELPDRL